MSVGPWGSGAFGTDEFSSSPFYNSSTLIDAILRSTGHATPSTESTKRAAIIDFLNNRYAMVSTLQHWNWLYQEVDTLFKEPYSTGTIDLEKGSQDVTGTGTVWSTNVVPNNVLYVKSRNETYLISEVTSQTALVLEGQFAGEDTTDEEYEIIKPIYTMPSDLEHIQGIQVDGVGKMIPKGRQEFTRLKQSFPGMTGAPRYFTEIGRRSDGVRLLEVFPAPDQNYTARLFYGVNITKLTDSTDSKPLIPDRHRQVLFLGGLADFYAYLRDIAMSEKYETLFQQSLVNMRNDMQLTDSKIQFQQGRNYKQRTRRRRVGYSYSAEDLAKLED